MKTKLATANSPRVQWVRVHRVRAQALGREPAGTPLLTDKKTWGGGAGDKEKSSKTSLRSKVEGRAPPPIYAALGQCSSLTLSSLYSFWALLIMWAVSVGFCPRVTLGGWKIAGKGRACDFTLPWATEPLGASRGQPMPTLGSSVGAPWQHEPRAWPCSTVLLG